MYRVQSDREDIGLITYTDPNLELDKKKGGIGHAETIRILARHPIRLIENRFGLFVPKVLLTAF